MLSAYTGYLVCFLVLLDGYLLFKRTRVKRQNIIRCKTSPTSIVVSIVIVLYILYISFYAYHETLLQWTRNILSLIFIVLFLQLQDGVGTEGLIYQTNFIHYLDVVEVTVKHHEKFNIYHFTCKKANGYTHVVTMTYALPLAEKVEKRLNERIASKCHFE